MSFEPPAGILDIGNATLRVGKLEVAETAGLNQGLQNIVKNDLLITEKETYLANKTWGIKLPTAWVGEFDLKTHDNKYVEFNFYNEGSTSNAHGYTLNFKDTTLTLKYDNGNTLASETIPDVSTSTYKKVNVFFERGVIAVFIDGARVLYFKESDTYNSVHGHSGMASRVASTTGGSFVNIFIEADGSDSAVKDLRIVNGRFISDKTSNVSFIGSLGVGVNSPKEALDIRGNMHLTRVSNVSQIKVDSNVVAEYTGPHDRPLRKYPEVALTADAATSSGYKGYKVTSSFDHTTYQDWNAFDGVTDATVGWHTGSAATNDIQYTGTDGEYNGTNATQLSSSSNTVNGEYLQIELPKAIKLKYYVLYPQGTSGVDQGNSPTRAVLYGSNDGSVWTELHRYTDAIYDTDKRAGIGYTFHVNSNQSYNYFAIVPTHRDDTAGTPANTSGISIGELELYGHEEGSASLDTTLKSVYNVPATTGTQLEVYYDGQDYSDMPTVGSASVIDKAGGDQTGTPSSGVSFDSTYKAFVFDGTTNGKIVGTHNLSGTSPVLTMSFWMKRTTVVGNYDYIATIGTSTTGQMIGLTTNPSNQFNFGNFGDGVITEETILLNQWYHVTLVANGEAVFNSTNFKPYINGKEPRLSGHGGGTTTNLTGTQLTLGTNTNSAEAFNGSIANFRLYSKALNADQVKELYDYQKDYFLGSKSQVTLYKGHLGVGVTEPSGQLELAGDERIQEYPPGPMSASGDGTDTHIGGHGVFTASASSLRNGYSAWWAFDKSTNQKWASDIGGGDTFGGGSGAYNGTNRLSSSTALGAWLKLKCPYKIKLQSFNIAGSPTSETPEDFIIYGSNDDNTWDQLFTNTGHPANTDVKQYNVNSISYYKYFAVVVTKVQSSTTILAITEWRLFGTPGPTTLDKGSLTLGRSLDVPRISRYDVDTETPRPEKLLIDLDTTVGGTGRGAIDISGRGNNLKPVNTASFYSVADKAYSFSGGTGVKYEGPATGYLGGVNPFSISLWFNSTDSGRTLQTVVGLGNYSTSPNNTLTGIRIQNDGKVGVLHYNNDIITTGSSLFEFNSWNHVVYVFNGSTAVAEQKLYINGVSVAVTGNFHTGASLLTPANANFSLGTWAVDNIYMFKGFISQPKLYNVALEPSEVRKLYNLGRTGRSMVISDTAVGIGKVPEAQLDVRGDLLVRGMPRTPQRPVFYAFDSGGTDTAGGFTGDVVFPNTRYNVGNCYNRFTGYFTAPVAGFYWFQFQVLVRRITADGNYEITLKKNGLNWSVRSIGYTHVTGVDDHDTLTNAVPIYLDPGDTVIPNLRSASSTGTDIYLGGELSHFTGFLIG